MFNKIFKSQKKDQKKDNLDNKNIMVAALLVHAAKMDENYTEIERKIIERALTDFTHLPKNKIEEILNLAEKKEQDSNQILEFTQEIKKNNMRFRLQIIELLWKIIYSDGIADQYETNLIRRVCGLLYISDKDNGNIKLKIKNQ
tara:strand:+ start:463 stop:894 length:432 start_codon:yes stop_codon:yes gene_type:complete